VRVVVDVGGSHVAAARVDWDPESSAVPELTGYSTAPLDAHASRNVLMEALVVAIESVCVNSVGLSDSHDDVVIALPGPFDYAHGVGSFDGVEKLEALAGFDLGTAISTSLGLPRSAMHFMNDAEAYALGEWRFGAGEQASRMVCVTLGTGVGSAFVDHGAMVRRGREFPGNGEVHRLRVEGRPLEDFVSARAISRSYQTRTSGSLEVRDICNAAREGDVDAVFAVGSAMETLGTALAPVLAAFDPSVLVVGGAISQSWDIISAPLIEAIHVAEPGLKGMRAARSRLLGDAPLLGAVIR